MALSIAFNPRVLLPRVLLVGGLIFCGSMLRADIIYSNFGPEFSYGFETGIPVANGTLSTSVGQEFSPVGNNYDLSSIEVVATSPNPDPTNTVTMSIFADNGSGLPGGTALEILTFSGQLPPFSTPDGDPQAGYLTFTSTLNPELLAGQNYWLVMDTSTAGETLDWDLNSTLKSGFVQTNGTPGDWTGLFPTVTNGVYEVDGTIATETTAAPEPQAWWLMAGGLAAVAGFRRRRQSGA
jgi:MYXO-CTERM domain-containing protein